MAEPIFGCTWPHGTFPDHIGYDDAILDGSSERDKLRTSNQLATISTRLAWLDEITYFLSENITFPLNSHVISGRLGRSLTVFVKRMLACLLNFPTEWLKNLCARFNRVLYKIRLYWFSKQNTGWYSQLLIYLEVIDIFAVFGNMSCSLLTTPGITSA